MSSSSVLVSRDAFAIAIAGVLLWGATADAQTGSVRGVVIEPRGPVPRVEILLTRTDAQSGAASLRATTDSVGRFAIPAIPAGRWQVAARRIGYAPAEQDLVLMAGRDTTLTIRLVPAPRALDTVAVFASGMPARYGPSSIMETFYERRKRGRGAFFTREQLEASGHGNLQPILASVPGTRLRTGRTGRIYLHFPRCTGSDIVRRGSGNLRDVVERQGRRDVVDTTGLDLFVDGVRRPKGDIPELLGDLRLDDIEAMEVYRGPSELPVEAMGNACAAIFIWTRRSPGSVLSQGERP